jgi:phosphoribosyl 1,2-cyclic phosphodiesterase
MPARRECALAGLVVEAWPVEHSLIAPAVGYRVAAGLVRVFYVPDVAHIPDPAAALRGVDVYIGDGATLVRPLVRRRGCVRIGHATIAAQLEWCASAGVRRAVFTHCGSGIVRADPGAVARAVQAMGARHGIASRIAYDGLRMTVTHDG